MKQIIIGVMLILVGGNNTLITDPAAPSRGRANVRRDLCQEVYYYYINKRVYIVRH